MIDLRTAVQGLREMLLNVRKRRPVPSCMDVRVDQVRGRVAIAVIPFQHGIVAQGQTTAAAPDEYHMFDLNKTATYDRRVDGCDPVIVVISEKQVLLTGHSMQIGFRVLEAPVKKVS